MGKVRKITIKEVAEHAEVSKSTVSQFLNKRYEYMASLTKKRIEEAIKELGYQPNIVARSLKQKSTRTIGVIVANILHTFSTEVSRAIEDVCNQRDFHTIVCNADDHPEKEKKYIEMLRAKQVDGLIIFPTGNNRTLYKQMQNENYPVVFIDREVSQIPITSVLLENKKAASIAIDHFIEKGHTKIAMITTSIIHNVTARVERLEGYKQSLKKNGIPVRKEYIGSVRSAEILETLEEMLNLDQPPQAILAGNDLVLIEVLKYIKQHHLRIPEDLAVIGIDDVSFASFYTPSITTVAQPTFRMGQAAAEILFNKMESSTNKDASIRFAPKLMVRNSG